jgi:hypothetical protein
VVPTPGQADGYFGPMTTDSLNYFQEHILQMPQTGGVYNDVTHLKLQMLADFLAR